MSLEPIRLDALTGELAHAFDSAMREAGLAYEVSCEPLPHPVLIDPDMWEKILLNLISNALKFTFEGKVRVSMAARGGEVELEVADTGIGIPAHELPHIFDRFHRVAGARARTQEGSGIGLALVHELARLLGGDVSAKSAVDGGTTMTVVDSSAHGRRVLSGLARLPSPRARRTTGSSRRRAAGCRTRTPPRRRPLRRSRAPLVIDGAERPARVLVVDDNADMREYLARMLAPHWTVETAVDGEAALTSIRARRPDVVLTDVMMPNLDGFGLVARLRADEATADLPVIVLSARAGEESRIEGLQVGADDYLVKPFSARELIARVQVHVSLAQLRRRLLDRAEEARRAAEDATRAKDEFLAMLGHELRNPLSPIVIAVELMRLRGVNSKELSVIERQLKQLMRLVDDLLDVSRIARGKVDLHKERTSIAEVVKRAAETTQPLFQERQQPLALDVPGDLFVDGDPTRLQQVFANLLTNASKYSDPGTGVGVSAKPVGDRVEIRVRDHGIGIRPEMIGARVRSVRAAAAGAGSRRRWAGSRPRDRQEPRGLARRLGSRRERRPGHGQRVHRDPAFDAGGGRRRAPRDHGSGDGSAPRIPGLPRARRRRQRGRCRDARGLARVDGPRRARRARRPGGPRRGRGLPPGRRRAGHRSA